MLISDSPTNDDDSDADDEMSDKGKRQRRRGAHRDSSSVDSVMQVWTCVLCLNPQQWRLLGFHYVLLFHANMD